MVYSIVNFRHALITLWYFIFVKVEVLDENSLVMNLEFSIRETTCRRDSGEDPATCAFQRDYYVVSGRRPLPEMNKRKSLTSSMTWSHTKNLAAAWLASGPTANSVDTVSPGGGCVTLWLSIELWSLRSWVILTNYLIPGASVSCFLTWGCICIR